MPASPQEERRYRIRYSLLTVVVFLPLCWAFLTVNNFYPIPVWSLFSEPHYLEQGRTYYVLRGVTVDGKDFNLPAIRITDALSGRNHMMVSYVVGNTSFNIDSPHPDNLELVRHRGGTSGLKTGELVEELLSSWGESYNLTVPAHSSNRLREIRLEQYLWPGRTYENFSQPVGTWRVEL